MIQQHKGGNWTIGLPSGTSLPDGILGWCGHPAKYYFEVGKLQLHLCQDCLEEVGMGYLRVVREDPIPEVRWWK